MLFPTRLLSPVTARFQVSNRTAHLKVELADFALPAEMAEAAGELQRTALVAERIPLDLSDLGALAGKSFDFPVNPTPGYIDGSIYLHHRHHPVDITTLSFRTPAGGAMTLYAEAVLVLSYEGLGPFADTPWTFTARIEP